MKIKFNEFINEIYNDEYEVEEHIGDWYHGGTGIDKGTNNLYVTDELKEAKYYADLKKDGKVYKLKEQFNYIVNWALGQSEGIIKREDVEKNNGFQNIFELYTDLNEDLSNETEAKYLVSPNISFLRKVLNKKFQYDNKLRFNILTKRKNELNLKEFKNLFDYYNYCNTRRFILLKNSYTPINQYCGIIADWVWYLTILQLFPNELKSKANAGAGLGLYEKQYEEILSLPRLTGDEDKDKIIMENVVNKYFYEKSSPVRNALILYYIHFKNNSLF